MFPLRPFFIVLDYDLMSRLCMYRTARRVLFVMNRVPDSWDPNVQDSDLERDLLAILQQAGAEEERQENNARLTDE